MWEDSGPSQSSLGLQRPRVEVMYREHFSSKWKLWARRSPPPAPRPRPRPLPVLTTACTDQVFQTGTSISNLRGTAGPSPLHSQLLRGLGTAKAKGFPGIPGWAGTAILGLRRLLVLRQGSPALLPLTTRTQSLQLSCSGTRRLPPERPGRLRPPAKRCHPSSPPPSLGRLSQPTSPDPTDGIKE